MGQKRFFEKRFFEKKNIWRNCFTKKKIGGGGREDEGGGLEGMGTSFLNCNLNYYCHTYKNVLSQISAKSQNK